MNARCRRDNRCPVPNLRQPHKVRLLTARGWSAIRKRGSNRRRAMSSKATSDPEQLPVSLSSSRNWMRRSTRICRKPPPNRPSFSLKIGSFVTPSGRAALGVGKSTLREERARRALLFSKTGRLLPIEVLESVLQGYFGCDDHASRFRHQLRIRIQRSDSETRKLRCLLACEYLVTPRDLRDDGFGSLRCCRPGPDRYHRNVVRLEILRHIERELIETRLGGTVGRIQVVGDGSIIGNIHHKRPIGRDQERCRIVTRNER